MYEEESSLIDIHEVRSRIRKHMAFHAEFEQVSLHDSMGRVLADDLRSDFDVPPSPRSAMDGYAVLAIEISTASEQEPVVLRNKGEITLGETFTMSHENRTCVKIPTGSAVPDGFDAVVPVEHTSVNGDEITITKGFQKGENIDPAGTFHMKGDLLFPAGKVLGANDIAALATLGKTSLRVRAKIKVAVLPTGSELIALGSQWSPEKVFDSNSMGVIAMLRATNLFEVTHGGILKDDIESISSAFDSYLRSNQLVISIGGTALGNKDLIPGVLAKRNPGIIFHGIKTKPGVPTLFAAAGDRSVIGLPGPPVSAFLVMYDIFRPILIEKAGGYLGTASINAVLEEDTKMSRGRYNIVPVKLDAGEPVRANSLQGSSAAVMRLSHADGYFTHMGEDQYLPRGTSVSVIPFHL